MISKPKLSAEQLIDKMKSKGITFNYISETEAENYLKKHNNYFRLASYRKNYDKYLCGNNKGKYIRLDFSYLTELSTIDMHLRFIILKMCLDIEHALKVQILNNISFDKKEDGYSIVKDFIFKYPYIKQEICIKRYSTYVGELINKYFTFKTTNNSDGTKSTVIDSNECPVWAFMEIIGFGDYIRFYDFYYSTHTDIPIPEGPLNLVKSLRNACAHNNCLIHNLRSGQSSPPKSISTFVAQIEGISKDVRNKKLKSRPILELTSLLYVYSEIVVDTVKKARLAELNELLSNRMLRNKDYFLDQQIICSTYDFFRKIVDFLR